MLAVGISTMTPIESPQNPPPPRVLAVRIGNQYRIECPHPWCRITRGKRKGQGAYHWHGVGLGHRCGHCLRPPWGASTQYILVDAEGNDR